eukprot:873914-Amphidinium_carterae.1
MSEDASVLLGDVGRQLPTEEQSNLRLSRLGGKPTWSTKRLSLDGAWLGGLCAKCRSERSFIGQLFAGYDGAPNGPTRVIYLFGCLRAGCASVDGAWKALR